ncbi:hypothetical protein [Methylobacterium sp. Gmos1]
MRLAIQCRNPLVKKQTNEITSEAPEALIRKCMTPVANPGSKSRMVPPAAINGARQPTAKVAMAMPLT